MATYQRIATGETYSFPEGRVIIFASASGSTSGSGVGLVRNAQFALSFGWREWQDANGEWHRKPTGARADINIDHLYADRTLFNLANGTAAVNLRFEGLTTANGFGRSGVFVFYSGVVDAQSLAQPDGDVFRASLAAHFNTWSGFGQ